MNRFLLYDEACFPPRLVGRFASLEKAMLIGDEEFGWPHPMRIDEVGGFIDGTTRRITGPPIPLWGLGARSRPEGTE